MALIGVFLRLSGLWDSEILKGIWILPGESEYSKDLQVKYSGMKRECDNKSFLKEVSGLVQEGMRHFAI